MSLFLSQAPTTLGSGLSLLKETRVGTLLPADHDNIICFSKNDTIDTIFKGLTENRILSAPLYDPIRHTHTCFVDIVDIVAFFLSKFKDDEPVEPAAVDKAIASFKNERCASISDLSGRNPFCPVEGMAPLMSAINMMVRWKVHRLPVVDSEGDLLTVITQSHIVNYIYSHMSTFDTTLTRATVESLGMVTSPIITISSDRKAIDAFKLMHEKRVSGLGVVNASGQLIGNLSASDLKLIGFDGNMFSRLYYPISEFMKLGSQGGSAAQQPVLVGLQNTFAEVVAKLAVSRIHRVYVVDQSLSPIGIITQHEVLRTILNGLPKV